MGIDLYFIELSPNSQSVLMALQALDLDVNKKIVRFHLGEHRTPEFLKLNPQHCVPTIVDDGFVLWESRAILSYLASTYDKTGKLYPGDIKKRALVDQKLFFDIGTLFPRFHAHYMVTVKNNLPVDPEKFKLVEEAVALLNGELETRQFVAGDDLTIADFCNLATIFCYDGAGFPLDNYPNVRRWMAKCADLGFKCTDEMLAKMKGFFAPRK